MKPLFKCGVAIVFAQILCGCGNTPNSNSADLTPPAQRRPLPAIPIKNPSGGNTVVELLPRRVTIINVLSSSCAACDHELPWLTKLSRNYKSKGLIVIGISADADPRAMSAYSVKMKIPYVVFAAGTGMGETISPYGVPLTLFVDDHRRLAAAIMGMATEARFTRIVENLLAE